MELQLKKAEKKKKQQPKNAKMDAMF